jgi:hypothetical protein
MKTKSTALMFAALLAIGVACRQAHADIIINNFSLTQNSLSFDISGTLPDPLPLSPSAFYFVNPDIHANPGFVLASNFASTYSFTGTQNLRDPDGVSGGNGGFGDFFYVAFTANMNVGETVSGTLTANWMTDTFDPSQVTTLDVYWGYNGGLANDGTYLTSVAIPEPSSHLLVAVIGMTVLPLRRNRQQLCRTKP